MKQADYAYGVSYIRSIENRLMDKGDIEGLILAKTPEEAIRILSDKGYSSEPVSPEQYEQLLSKQLEECWRTVREVAPKEAPLDIFLYQNDFHNLKVALKAMFTNTKEYSRLFLYPNTVDCNLITDALSEQAFLRLPEMLRSAAIQAYETLAETEDSQLADVIIDKAAMDYMYVSAQNSGSAFVKELVGLKNTLLNIKIAYRSIKTQKDRVFLERAMSEGELLNKEYLIQAVLNGEDSFLSYLSANGFEEAVSALKISLTQFEKYADKAERIVVDKAKFVTFGIEPLVAYILKKQAELLTVRIIMSCKVNGLAESNIRERLRD